MKKKLQAAVTAAWATYWEKVAMENTAAAAYLTGEFLTAQDEAYITARVKVDDAVAQRKEAHLALTTLTTLQDSILSRRR